MQGLASLPTFWAMPESRWPRAAIERAGGKRIICASRSFTDWIPGCAEDDAYWECSPHPNLLPQGARGNAPAATKRKPTVPAAD